MIKSDKKIIKKISTFFLSFILVFTFVSTIFSSGFIHPSSALAQVDTNVAGSKLDYSGLVDCDGVVKKDKDGNYLEPERTKRCNFAALMGMVIKIVNWLFYFGIAFAIILFAYSGFLYMTGKQENIKKAKSIFYTVGVGFIIMLVAWLGVQTGVSWLTEANSGATSLIGGDVK